MCTRAHDEIRRFAKCSILVVRLLEALPDDRIRMHVARSTTVSEVLQIIDSTTVESNVVPQNDNPVIDVRITTVGALARSTLVP